MLLLFYGIIQICDDIFNDFFEVAITAVKCNTVHNHAATEPGNSTTKSNVLLVHFSRWYVKKVTMCNFILNLVWGFKNTCTCLQAAILSYIIIIIDCNFKKRFERIFC